MPRNPGLLFFASGLVALLVLVLLPDTAGETPRAILGVYGLTAAVLGGYAAYFGLQRDRARVTLANAENVIARWQVDATLWRDWLAYEPRLAEDERARGGTEMHDELHVDRLPYEGFGVTVGREAIDVGGNIHLLPLRGTPEVLSAAVNEARARPSFLELRLKHPDTATSSSIRYATFTVLRIPLPTVAIEDARRAAAHYNRDVPSAPDFFHGRGDGTDAEDLSRCWNCGFETHKFRSQCERCGSSLQSRRWSRRFGVALTVCGTILTGLMGTVMFFTLPKLLRALVGSTDAGFDGGPGMAIVVLLIFCAVLAFGLTTLTYGAFQVATGRRDKRILRVAFPLIGVVAVLGLAVAAVAG